MQNYKNWSVTPLMFLDSPTKLSSIIAKIKLELELIYIWFPKIYLRIILDLI